MRFVGYLWLFAWPLGITVLLFVTLVHCGSKMIQKVLENRIGCGWWVVAMIPYSLCLFLEFQRPSTNKTILVPEFPYSFTPPAYQLDMLDKISTNWL